MLSYADSEVLDLDSSSRGLLKYLGQRILCHSFQLQKDQRTFLPSRSKMARNALNSNGITSIKHYCSRYIGRCSLPCTPDMLWQVLEILDAKYGLDASCKSHGTQLLVSSCVQKDKELSRVIPSGFWLLTQGTKLRMQIPLTIVYVPEWSALRSSTMAFPKETKVQPSCQGEFLPNILTSSVPCSSWPDSALGCRFSPISFSTVLQVTAKTMGCVSSFVALVAPLPICLLICWPCV